MGNTFVDSVEDVVDSVSAWGVGVIKSAIDALAPDGRGYGQEAIPLETQLEKYRQMRNNLDAWKAWLNVKTMEIQKSLTESGMPPETVGAIDVLEVSKQFMYAYCTEMENELAKRTL